MMKSLVVAAAVAAASAAGQLYGIGNSGNWYVLQKVNADGTTTNVGQPITNELIAQELSCIDQAKGIYYYVGFDMAANASNLVGLKLTDGSVAYKTKLPFYEPAFVGVGQMVSCGLANGDVIVGGQTGPNSGHVVGTLSPSTGAFKQVASFPPSLIPVLGGVSAYDPVNNVFVMELGTSTAINWYTVNMGSGKTASWPGCDILETLDFDPVRKTFIGVGMYANETRNVGIMDANTGACSVLGSVPGYFIIEAGEGAYDGSTGTLWTVMQPTSGGSNAPFDLLSISTNPGVKVKTAKTLEGCPNPNNCPWQIEYYYGT